VNIAPIPQRPKSTRRLTPEELEAKRARQAQIDAELDSALVQKPSGCTCSFGPDLYCVVHGLRYRMLGERNCR